MNGATVPQSVIDAARNANAAVEKVEGEKLFIIRVKNGDDACTVVNKWIESLPENVSAMFAPTLLPGGLAWPILQEANSIINHYAPFNEATFARPASKVS